MISDLLWPVVTASLLGSLHCAGMCGGFVAAYSGADGGARRVGSHLAYHAGRLISYVTLGAGAGALGGVVDLAATAAGVGRVAGALAGVLMVAWALAALLEAGGAWRRQRRSPTRLGQRAVTLLGALSSKSPLGRAGLFGLASALLPCGWLYAFVIAAAGAGSAAHGALVMAAFWSGTVPLLLGLGAAVQSLAPRMRRHVPVLSAAALLVLGLTAVLGRWNPPVDAARAFRDNAADPPCCHVSP